jgi:hypothetical protein
MEKNSYFCRNLQESEEGVAGIVVALLLIGLIVSAFGFVQAVYVPQWMEEKEAEHMDTVLNQFSQLKFSIDTLSVLSKKYSSISSPIALGSKEMPFFSSARAYGSLKIDLNECKIIFTDSENQKTTYTLGALEYKSQNAYFLNQDYAFETGGVILSQSSGDILIIQPSIFIEENKDLSFDLIKLISRDGKVSASGYGTYPVKTSFSDSQEKTILDVKTIEIYNSYVDAWEKYFDNLLSRYSDINYSIDETTDGAGIIISFLDPVPNTPDVSVKITDIEIQISPGWVD